MDRPPLRQGVVRGVKGSTGPHGTRARYASGCRCAPCRGATAAYERRRRRERARGAETPLVDAARAREHVLSLMASSQGRTDGLGYERLADLAGVSRGITRALIYGVSGRPPSKKLRRDNEAKILAVGPDMLADGATVDGAATRQMVECLAAFGVSKTKIGHALGNRYPGVRVGDRVRVRTEKAVEGLHWGLWRRHGPFRAHCSCRPSERAAEELEKLGKDAA